MPTRDEIFRRKVRALALRARAMQQLDAERTRLLEFAGISVRPGASRDPRVRDKLGMFAGHGGVNTPQIMRRAYGLRPSASTAGERQGLLNAVLRDASAQTRRRAGFSA